MSSYFDSLNRHRNGGSSGSGGTVQINDASTSEKGIIQIATNEEVAAGTDETKAVVPKTLKTKIEDLGGIPLWSATKNYKKDDVVKVLNASNKIVIYFAKANNVNDNPLTSNTGKWEIIGNVFGDLTSNLTANTFNVNNGAFNNQHKLTLKKLDDIYYVALKYTFTTPIIDLMSTKRKILELPNITDVNEMVGYITTPSGKRMSEENREYFHINTGDGYINKATYHPTCNVKTLIVDGEGRAVQKKNNQTGTPLFSGEIPLCNDTVITLNVDTDTTIYRLKNPLNLVGQDSNGNNLWETEEITARCNLDYMYAVAMHNNGCNVDTNGNMGHYEFQEAEISAAVRTDSRPMARYGYNGTATFIIDTHTSKSKEIPVYIHDSAIYIDGDVGISDITIRGNF